MFFSSRLTAEENCFSPWMPSEASTPIWYSSFFGHQNPTSMLLVEVGLDGAFDLGVAADRGGRIPDVEPAGTGCAGTVGKQFVEVQGPFHLRGDLMRLRAELDDLPTGPAGFAVNVTTTDVGVGLILRGRTAAG